MPATAQAAKIQGQWLGGWLNASATSEAAAAAVPDFEYVSQGQMAYVGNKVCVADLNTHSEVAPTVLDTVGVGLGKSKETEFVVGGDSLVNYLWKGAYWSMLAGPRSTFMVKKTSLLCSTALVLCLLLLLCS